MENRFEKQANESQYFHLAQTLSVVGSKLRRIIFEVNNGYPQICLSYDRADGSYEPHQRLFFRNELTDADLAFLRNADISDADLAWGAYSEKETIVDEKTGEVRTLTKSTIAQKPSVVGLTVNGKSWSPSGGRHAYQA